jgi:hypothetical protein
VVEVFWPDKTNTGDWYLVTEFVEGEKLKGKRGPFAIGRRLMLHSTC